MPMPSPPNAPQSQPKTLIHPHEQCSAAFEQWSRVMEYITLHWKASSQLKSLASKPAADPNLLRLLNSAVNRPPTEGEGDQYSHQNGSRDTLSSKTVSSEACQRTLIPWMPEDKVYTPGLMGLHEEIVDFYNYMAPLQEEVYMRTEIVNRLRQVATSLWANAEVKVYGSFDTGLYLPTSDIDVVIKCPDLEPLAALTQLEQNLIKQGDCDDVKVIRTSVPIVKFTDKSTATKVDVSINIEGALTSAEFIKKMMATYPELKYLGFVLKQFLTSRGLLESFNGGISSYCLVLLIISYLQLHPEDRLVNNYGIQLIKFLELYGRHFNYLNCGIRVTDGGSYFRKGENSMGDKFSLLCVEDPFNADNDVGQSCFGAMKVREEFDRAFRELCDGVLPQYSHLQPPSTSLLARVLHIAPEVVAYRRFVFERYRHLCHSPAAMTGPFFLSPGTIPNYTQIQQHQQQQQQQQQSMNHFNPHLTPSHHQYGPSTFQPGQGQQLNFNHPPLTAAPPVALFQQQFPYQQIMAADGFQQTTFRYNYPVLSNVIAPPVPLEGIFPNQMVQLQVRPACSEDRSDSDSLSSQHSSQSSQVSQGLGNNLAGNGCNKTSSESQQDQEAEITKSSTPLPSVEPALSTSSLLSTVTTSTTTYSHNRASATTTVTVVSGDKSSDGNSPEDSNRSSSSNRLDTLCEITASSRHSNMQVVKSSNSHHHQHRLDRHHQSNRSIGYNEESTRSHYIQRANSTKHNNGSNKSFPHTASYSGSSPPLDSSSRSLHQSRHGGNRSGTNHKNQTNISASPVTSAHLVESAPAQRGKASNNPTSQSPVSNSSTSVTTQQHYHRNGPSHIGSSVWTSSHKAARKSNTYPPNSNNFSRNSFKNQKISQSSSSSSSSSSCSPTYSPATMTAR